MSSLQMKSKGSVDKNSLHTINVTSNRALTASNILLLNRTTSNNASMPEPASNNNNNQLSRNQSSPAASMPGAASRPHTAPQMQGSSQGSIHTTSVVHLPDLPIPAFSKPIQKGQKLPLFTEQAAPILKACLGWNVRVPQCDIDVSAFLLGENDKVLGDAWFVFYGQPDSPDGSTHFYTDNKNYREALTIDFAKLNPNVKKIVFVLTIHEALQKHLNFSMVKDAYIRLIDERTNLELASFKLTDYYSNVISMMIGEIYIHNDTWKLNAIGNGVAKDLAGLCQLYGVQVDD